MQQAMELHACCCNRGLLVQQSFTHGSSLVRPPTDSPLQQLEAILRLNLGLTGVYQCLASIAWLRLRHVKLREHTEAQINNYQKYDTISQ
jgi:hypothetical protein